MNTKLQQKLFKKYPKIFKRNNKKPQTPFDMFGIECGDGWYWLIDKVCDSIQNYTDFHNEYDKKYCESKNQIEQFITIQLKEKFSSGRWYYSGGDARIEGFIDLFEKLTYHICEDCGTNLNIGHTKGWIKTLCKDCAEKQDVLKNWKLDKLD